MKKRMKKVATLCLAGVTAMSTVGVTGSAVFAKGDTNYDVDNMDFENVELRVAFRFNNGSDTDGQAKWYYKALDEFNKENEGKIHVTDESISTESDYEEKLTTDFASGNVPNAFLQYGGSRTREYVDAGYILDLTPYFEQYPEWKEGVQDFAWETTQFDGIEGTYGIPWSAYQLCLYYNKDYLDQVGVDVPESWDDLVDACAKLKDAGIQPFNYSDKDNYHFEHLMSALALKAYGTIPEMGICILHDRSNGSGSLYTDPDQQHCNSIKCKEQPVLPDPDLCCVWYVPGDIPLYRIHGWNLQEPG